MRHDTTLASHLAHPTSAKIIHFFLVLVKRLVCNVVDTLVPRRQQQANLARFLGQGADGKALEPTLECHTTAGRHEEVKAAGHRVFVITFPLVPKDSGICDFHIVLIVIVHLNFVHRVATTKSVTAGTFVLVLTRVVNGDASTRTNFGRRVVQVIFLGTSADQVKAGAHTAAATQDT
jgi:hypothetical protein